MEKEFTLKVKTYLGEELTISGSTMGFIELRNMIADASRYHDEHDRVSWSQVIWNFWTQLEIPEDEENE